MQNRHVIELSPSGKTFDASQELLLDAMLASGLPVPFSCRRGAFVSRQLAAGTLA